MTSNYGNFKKGPPDQISQNCRAGMFLYPTSAIVGAELLVSAMTTDLRSEFSPRALSSISVPNVAVRSMSRDLDNEIQRMTATNARL